MTPSEDARDGAGAGGRDGVDLVGRLSADPEALREYIEATDGEIRELRRFASLAAGCAEAVLQRSERFTNTR